MQRIKRAFHNSLAGLKSLKGETAFWQECALAAVLIPLALLCGESPPTKALLIASVLFVLVVEIQNTAIEAIVDRIGPERHPLSKKAKDLGSLAVLLSFVQLIIVWAIIFLG